MSTTDSAVWLVTGCSTGIGREIALAALRQGYKVGVSARRLDSVADIVAEFPESAIALQLDVTVEAQRATAVNKMLAQFGRFDVLVNNAGYGYLSSIEEGDEQQIRAMFETNFFGLLALTQAVLPHLRRQRSGHIVNISSQAGVMANPGTGFYSSSKYAVEGLTEALYKELAPLGIKVTAVQPGPFRTDWAGRSMQLGDNSIADYAEHVGSRVSMISQIDGQQPGDPVRAANAVLQLVAMEQPPAKLLLGSVVLDSYREKLQELAESIDRWEALTRSADYPQ